MRVNMRHRMQNFVAIGETVVEIWRYFDFSSCSRLDVGFLKFEILTVGQLKNAELRRHAKFGQNRSNRGQNMAIFRFFKMAAAAILDFTNCKFLTVGQLKRAELRRCTKFGRNRSNRSRDMAILNFSRWRPPPSWIFQI